MRQEVDLERDFVAVHGDGVSLGGGDGCVVDEDVQVRVIDDDSVCEPFDLFEAGEVRAEGAQLLGGYSGRGGELVGRCLRLFGRAAVYEDGGAALGEQPCRLVADAGGGPGNEHGAGGKIRVGHGPSMDLGTLRRPPRLRRGAGVYGYDERAPDQVTAPRGYGLRVKGSPTPQRRRGGKPACPDSGAHDKATPDEAAGREGATRCSRSPSKRLADNGSRLPGCS